MDPNVARLIERTRARRAGLKEGSVGGSPLPSERERSPLKERNAASPTRGRSPAKASPFHERLASPTKERLTSPSKASVEIPVTHSPGKARQQASEASPSDTIRRLLHRDPLQSSVQDLLNRASPGKVSRTVTTSTDPAAGTTVTKTVITEHEERVERKEVISYSGNRRFMEEVEGARVEVDSSTYRKSRDQARSPNKSPVRSFKATTKSPEKSPTKSPVRSFRTTTKSPEKSPAKSPCRKEAETRSPERDQLSPMRELDFHEGRRARLANLANKFRDFDEDSDLLLEKEEVRLPRPAVKPAPRAASPSKHAAVRTDHLRRRSPSPTKANPLQFVSPSKASPVAASSTAVATTTVATTTAATTTSATGFRSVLAAKAAATAPTQRPPSPTKPPAPRPPSPIKQQDQSFVTSLKAQGFQETSSKSKLVYNFDKKKEEEEERTSYADNVFLKNDEVAKEERVGRRERDQLSPMRESMVEEVGRAVSPVRANPFLQRDQARASHRARSPTKDRAPSPTKPHNRAASPTKPQPRAVSPVKARAPLPPAPSGPPKPSRTFETEEREEHRTDTLQARSVTQKRSMFEAGAPPAAESPDPSVIPLSQRKALFEKIKSVPTPIARFGESVTPAMLAKKAPSSTETPSEAWKRKRAASPQRAPSPGKQLSTPHAPRAELGTPRGVGEARRQLAVAATPDWRDNEIARKAAREKQQEMDVLLNRYRHVRQEEPMEEAREVRETRETREVREVREEVVVKEQSPERSERSERSERYYPGVQSMKRVKVSPPKEGQLYPQIDFDSDRAESVMSCDTLDDSYESQATQASEAPSLGKDIVIASRMAPTDQELSTIPEVGNTSMDTEGEAEGEGEGLTDSLLEEALDEPTPPKVAKTSTSSSGSERALPRTPGRSESVTSWEFHTPQQPAAGQANPKFKTPMIVAGSPAAEGQRVEVEGEEGGLLHTVSFYRAQRPASTPVQRIVLEPRLEERVMQESPRATISQKIQRLKLEADTQMPKIQQTSQALNLCRATKEFFGSSEQVEAERLLLEASHKRAAALTEIQKLKTEGGLGADPRQEASTVRGTVSLCGITLRLKQDFVKQVRSGEAGDFVHFFLCLVKSAGQVIPTTMVSTADGLDGHSLHFPNLINFRELSKDFAIHMEVYGLQTRKEVLAHEAKYHIGAPKPGLLATLTPKMKFSKTESKLARPAVSSPGGPQAVRTSSFAMVGQAVITLGSLAETSWRLASVPPISPLEGTVNFTLNAHSESQITHRGFLTMFHDVSGSGAWRRWWMVVEGSGLSYWTYPEDEARKEPVGWIDLAQCSSPSVALAPRDLCSRMNTFMLETERAPARDDKTSLVVVSTTRERTVVRHLLSADSRVERVTWCDLLNKALDNLRAWDTTRTRSGSSSSLDTADTASQASAQSTEIW